MNPLGDIIAPELYGSSVAGGEASPAPNAARAVLLHYASIIDRVGGEGGILFATRLRTLADPVRTAADAFARYLSGGDPDLSFDERSLHRPWRSFFRYDGQWFRGSEFIGAAWPQSLGGALPEVGRGAFYFGLWDEVIEALRDGRIADTVSMKVEAGSSWHNEKLFVLLADGTALAWAREESALTPVMFDYLFARFVAAPNKATAEGALAGR